MREGIVVTGASTGIGRACALALERAGFRVFAGVRREADGVALADSGGAIVLLSIEVTDAKSLAAARLEVERVQAGAPLRGVLANAGVLSVAPLEDQPIADLRRVLEVNFLGALATAQTFLPLLRASRGRVAFMSSTNGRMALPFLGSYSASKFALEGAADALRIELAPAGVHVALIEPGAIATPMLASRRIEDLAASLLPGALARYEQALIAMLALMEKTRLRAAPVDKVAQAVVHAFTARSPKSRYPVGADAKLASWVARSLPDVVRDAILAREIGLPRGG